MAQLLRAPSALGKRTFGIELFHVASSGGILSVPPAVTEARRRSMLGALAAVALLTAVPARIGARHPVAGILRAELA